jgi:NAD-reducing hydrogenase large subunit
MQAEPEIARAGSGCASSARRSSPRSPAARIHGTRGSCPAASPSPSPPSKRDAIGRPRRGLARPPHAGAAHSIQTGSTASSASFGDFPSRCTSPTSSPRRHLGAHRRQPAVIDGDGSVVVDQSTRPTTATVLGEAGKSDSYLKSPTTGRSSRVTTRARDVPGRPAGPHQHRRAVRDPDRRRGLADFRERYGRIASSSFLYHHARVLEVIACAERIAALMDDPVLLDTRVRAPRRHQPQPRGRRLRGAPRHADPRLRGRRHGLITG